MVSGGGGGGGGFGGVAVRGANRANRGSDAMVMVGERENMFRGEMAKQSMQGSRGGCGLQVVFRLKPFSVRSGVG